ncbi:MAG: hypothetical protein Q8R92_00125 [Deltaproteobacteria bacterium]|nr:hypothetical protein [Deltaproteobacteria bacterium]
MRTLPVKSMLAVAVSLLLLFASSAEAMSRRHHNTQVLNQEYLNLNYASQSQLETLLNMDRGLARRIINNRPYHSMEDLSRAGVSQRTINGLYNVAYVSNPRYGSQGHDHRYSEYQNPGWWSSRVWTDPHRMLYYRKGSSPFGQTRGGTYMSEKHALKNGFHLASNWNNGKFVNGNSNHDKNGNKWNKNSDHKRHGNVGKWDADHRDHRNTGNWDADHRGDDDKENHDSDRHGDGKKDSKYSDRH